MREQKIIGAYILALATFAGLAIVVFFHFGRFGDQTQRVHHTQEVLTRLEEGLGQLRDIEIGQRGYLLAGDEVFLEPYEASVEVVRDQFDELETLTADIAAQQKRLHQLRPIIDEKLAFTDRTIERFRQGDREEARAMVTSRRGKLLMDDIRRRVADMEAEERRLLERRTQRAESTAWRTTLLILFGNAFAFAFLTTGTILIGRELNRRRRLEEKLGFREERESLRERAEQAQRRLEAVVDEMPVGVVVAQAPTAEVVLFNSRMCELYGGSLLKDEEEKGRELELLRADGTPFPAGRDPMARALRNGEVVRGEAVQLRRADGRPHTVIADTAPVRDRNGRVLSAVGVFRDYAELERSEEERRRSQRFRDLFLSALGHDLRNPLSVITAGAASLSRRATTAEESKVVARMASSAERMARMIDQLLDLTQARLGGQIPIEPRGADLGEIAQQVVDRLEVVHPERTIELVSEGELTGVWDITRIRDVAQNLVTNAIEHGRQDAPVRVTARPGEGGAEAVLEVHNWGNPIPREMVPLIFDPFRRAAERKRMKSVGLGLGLYLSLQIVHAHGGTIDVESSAESGTVFRVSLPRSHG